MRAPDSRCRCRDSFFISLQATALGPTDASDDRAPIGLERTASGYRGTEGSGVAVGMHENPGPAPAATKL